jgi:hypothetical protein
MMPRPGRLPLSPSILATSAVLLLTGLAAVPLIDWFDSYDAAIATEQGKVNALTRLRHDQLAIQRERAQLEQTWTLRTDSRLQADLDALLDTLAIRSHAQTFRPAGITPAGTFEEVLIELTLTDLSHDQLVTLLQAIESMPPPLHIKTMTWRRRANDTHTNELTLTVAAYQRAATLTTPTP